MNQNNMHWASVWGNAASVAENRPEGYGKNITLCYPIYSAFGGDALRLTYDNFCGTEPITITKTTVCVAGVFYGVTFGGAAAVTVPAGERAVSDALSCKVEAESTLEVRFYLGDHTQMRAAVVTHGPLSKGSYALGDQTEEKEIPLAISRETQNFYFLSNVSVYTHESNRTLVCYGDSITAQNWPEELNLRCRKEGYSRTVIRRAISGSRILREYNCLTYESYGPKGERRFPREVPTDGADGVLIQHGINDLIHPVGAEVNPFRPMTDLPTAEELIEGLKRYIRQARSFGYKVYVGTLLPIEGWRTYAPFRDELRKAYNQWIRTTDLIDGFVDFEKAVCDPENPAALRPEYDSGDHLHLSAAGYRAMAEAVPEEWLK